MSRQLRGGLPEYGYVSEGAGLRKGVALVVGADQIHAKIAAVQGAGRYRGVQIDEGVLPDGTADPTIPDLVNAQKQGIAQALVPAASSASEGDLAWSDSTGKFIRRPPFSTSGFVYGQFDETFTAGSNPELHGVELFPQYIESMRSITAGSSSTLTAATKYLAPGYVAVAAAEVPVYVARFTGETVRNLGASLLTAPGGTDTAVFTIMKSSDNGATWSALANTCTITGTAKAAQDLTHTAVLAAGDLLAVQVVSSATTAAVPFVTFDVT